MRDTNHQDNTNDTQLVLNLARERRSGGDARCRTKKVIFHTLPLKYELRSGPSGLSYRASRMARCSKTFPNAHTVLWPLAMKQLLRASVVLVIPDHWLGEW